MSPPRYRPSRALPAQAYLPGRSPRPELDAPPAAEWDAYLWGVDLYNHGYFWEAHEVWEGVWRGAHHDVARRAFLQGLIQCSAACLKARLGDEEACRRLASRGLARLCKVSGTDAPYMGLRVARFVAKFQAFANSSLDFAGRPLLEIEDASDPAKA